MSSMSIIPGKPHEPTIHPRTKPEANEFALKNRQTNDWFRHDGKNIEQEPVPPLRLKTQLANEIASKNKGLTENWFEHSSKGTTNFETPNRKCHTEEARKTQIKVYGKDEAWFKHDDNQHFYEPCKDRLSSANALELKKKYDAAQTGDWYGHESRAGEGQNIPKPRTGPLKTVLENADKIQGKHSTPDWFIHRNTPGDEQLKTRLTMKEAVENCQKDRTGTPGAWFGHDHQESDEECGYYDANSEGEHWQGDDSEDWFRHDSDQTRGNVPHQRQYTSDAVRETVERAKGGAMQRLMNMDKNSSSDFAARKCIRPDGEEIAQKNSQSGMMRGVLNHQENRGYVEVPPCPRAVRPEAEQTFEKNKGVMGDCLQGYLPIPIKKSVHKAQPADKSLVLKHTGSSMAKTIHGDPPTSGRAFAGRTIKPEAEENAERNKGTMKLVIGGYAADSSDGAQQRGPRLRTEAAQEIARKYHGSINNLIC